MRCRSEYPIVTKKPVLITDAARSQDDQYRARQIRYATMMGVRTACLIVGTILVSVRPPLLWLWLTLCGLGMVLLPWMAVLIANDRPAKTKEERAASAAARERHQAALAEQPVEEVEYLTIDVEPEETGARWVAPEQPEREHRNT